MFTKEIDVFAKDRYFLLFFGGGGQIVCRYKSVNPNGR